jgi:hypothetical protein
VAVALVFKGANGADPNPYNHVTNFQTESYPCMWICLAVISTNNIATGMVRGDRKIRFHPPKVRFHPIKLSTTATHLLRALRSLGVKPYA